ncbi:hypothetical protein ACTJJ0_30900 [Chitinophaga sp. 22321]|uniref:Uncharacterized protein n=1 Tax=Chitinophaga hostae TaxID=2831022 RepID=A0ABS5J8Q9_9BACT|nr:hypothetical protein [Chitinophaga hostae]MBS0031594.1 hypothetical protein [Chitinophaga hostae]
MITDVISRRAEGPTMAFTIKEQVVSETVLKTYKYLLNRKGQFISPVTIGMTFGIHYRYAAGWATVQLLELMKLKLVEKRYQFGNHQPVAYGIPDPDKHYNQLFLQ